MNYSDTKTLYPNDEKSVGFDKESLEQLKNINERLDNMSNDIADLNNEVDGLDNQVVTENLQAAQASLQEASVNELSAQSASISELEAGNATANKVTSRGKIKGAQLEISGISHLKDDVTVEGKVTSASVRAGSVTTDHLIADEMDVTDFTVDELSVSEKATIKEEEVETSVVTTQTVSSQTVESQEVTSQNVVSQDVTSQEVTNQEVENAVIDDAEIKALTSGGNTFSFNSDNSIAITEDSFICIKPEALSEIRLILKTAQNVTILAVAVSVDVTANGVANLHVIYTNRGAATDIYFDNNKKLWIKLDTGIRGTLYFMQGGINKIIPETDSVINPPFDPAAEGTIHYAAETRGDIVITSKVIFNANVAVEGDALFNKDVDVAGNVHVEGNMDVDGHITVGGLATERAQYLGNSDYVTADDNGNLEAKDGSFDGDVTATGEISSTGDMTAGGDVNAVGDVSGTNAEFSGTVKAEDGFEGNLTGDVDGDVTGNADTADKWKTARDIKIQDADGTNVSDAVSLDGSENKTLKLPTSIKADFTGSFTDPDAVSAASGASSKVAGFDANGKLIPVNPLDRDYDAIPKDSAELKAALEDSNVTSILLSVSGLTVSQNTTVNGDKQFYKIGNFGLSLSYGVTLTAAGNLYFFGIVITGSSNTQIDCQNIFLYENSQLVVAYKRVFNCTDSKISITTKTDYSCSVFSATNSDISINKSTADAVTDLGRFTDCTVSLSLSLKNSSATTVSGYYFNLTEIWKNNKVTVRWQTKNVKTNYIINAPLNEMFVDCEFNVIFVQPTSSASSNAVFFPKAIFELRSQNGTSGIFNRVHGCDFNVSIEYDSPQRAISFDGHCYLFEIESCTPIGFCNNSVNLNFYHNTSLHDKFFVFGIAYTQVYNNNGADWISDIKNCFFRLVNTYNTALSYQPSFVSASKDAADTTIFLLMAALTGCNFITKSTYNLNTELSPNGNSSHFIMTNVQTLSGTGYLSVPTMYNPITWVYTYYPALCDLYNTSVFEQ
jgi:hypothetical protein